MINITTTHTITCDNAPVEDVYRELDEKFPQLNPIIGQKLQLREERDDARSRANRLFEENKILSRDNGFAMRRIDALTDDVARRISRISELQAKVDELTRERDEAQKRLEESLAVEEKLIAENKSLAARDDALDGAFETQQMRINRLERKLKGAEDALTEHEPRPALPEGMRIAEHEVYGRVVVSPYTASDRYYRIFALDDETPYRADCFYTKPSALTFLDSDPEPAQALAEETWEYRYERKLIYQTNEWIPMGDGHKWYATPEIAKRATSHEPNSLPVRLTRRRVSPPEVIND